MDYGEIRIISVCARFLQASVCNDDWSWVQIYGLPAFQAITFCCRYANGFLHLLNTLQSNNGCALVFAHGQNWTLVIKGENWYLYMFWLHWCAYCTTAWWCAWKHSTKSPRRTCRHIFLVSMIISYYRSTCSSPTINNCHHCHNLSCTLALSIAFAPTCAFAAATTSAFANARVVALALLAKPLGKGEEKGW